MSETEKKSAPWLAESSLKKRTATVKKFTDAMAAIELDIQANDKLYPFNGGTVNQAEVCRRAGVKPAILQAPTHIESTKLMVDEWVTAIKKKLITGRRNVRKAVTERVDDWKLEHGKVLNAYHIDMLKLEVSEARIRELTAENEALREQIGKGVSNVRALNPKKKKADDSQA